MFVYGSLISRNSIDGVGQLNIPVGVSGLKRGWYAPVAEDRNTGLGAVVETTSVCNGVLVKASDDYLVSIDSRETKHGYSRVKLPSAFVRSSYDAVVSAHDTWIYLIDTPTVPTQDCPIAQSYLDVVLAGCLEISEDFAAEFILTTHGWEHFWINDRTQPRYRRYVQADAKRIDSFLSALIPAHLAKRHNISC